MILNNSKFSHRSQNVTNGSIFCLVFEIVLANQKNTLYLFLDSCVCFGSRHYWCYSCKFQFSINCDSCIFRFLQSILCIMTCIWTHNTRRKFQEHIRCQILFIWKRIFDISNFSVNKGLIFFINCSWKTGPLQLH